MALERCCQVQLQNRRHGYPEDRCEYSRRHVGSDFIGWPHFQTLYDQIAGRGNAA
jgi:hypothetical protein